MYVYIVHLRRLEKYEHTVCDDRLAEGKPSKNMLHLATFLVYLIDLNIHVF